MGEYILRWPLPGAGLGWLAALFALGWILPHQAGFVDSLGWGLALLVVLPAVIGAAVATGIGALLAAVMGRRPAAAVLAGRWIPRGSLSMGAVVLLLTLASALAPPARLHTRLMVYGVDGATWSVIDGVKPLGMLPAFEQLRADGASGTLRSIEPMLSPIVWTTIASGVGMDGHGIAGFHVNNDQCQAARFWDVLEDRGMVVGTYKWLVTYPPREVRGFMVPGWLATGPEVVPEDLAFARAFEQGRKARFRNQGAAAPAGGQEAATQVGALEYVTGGVRHGLRLSTLVELALFTAWSKLRPPSDEDRMLAIQTLRARIDRDLFFGLMTRYDPEVATFTYYPTDAVAHRMWRYYEPDLFGGVDQETDRYWDAVPSTYREADDMLAELRRRLPDDALLMVISDHGMTAAGNEGGVAVYGLRAGQVEAALDAAGAAVDVSQVGMKVTVAVAQGSAMTPEQVAGMLGRFTLGDRPLFALETLSAGVYGLTLAVEGDARARAAEPVTLPDGSTVPFETFLRMRADYSGVHREDGVILMAGPGVRAGGTIEDADLYDVAPTALAAMGVPPSGEMEGRVLDEAFETPPAAGEGPESYGSILGGFTFLARAGGEEGDAALEERLRALGYVDGPADPPEAPTPGEGQ